MSEKTWRRYDWLSDDCPECGDAPEVLTDADDGFVWDGDAVRCAARCGETGSMHVDGEEDAGEAWIAWTNS